MRYTVPQGPEMIPALWNTLDTDTLVAKLRTIAENEHECAVLFTQKGLSMAAPHRRKAEHHALVEWALRLAADTLEGR